MDRQQLLPVREREIDDRLDDLDTGIADQDVDPAVLGHHVGHALLHRRLVHHVHADREGVRALRPDLGRRRVGRIQVQVGDHRNAALGSEAQRDLLADAAGGTGNNSNFSVETSPMVQVLDVLEENDQASFR